MRFVCRWYEQAAFVMWPSNHTYDVQCEREGEQALLLQLQCKVIGWKSELGKQQEQQQKQQRQRRGDPSAAADIAEWITVLDVARDDIIAMVHCLLGRCGEELPCCTCLYSVWLFVVSSSMLVAANC